MNTDRSRPYPRQGGRRVDVFDPRVYIAKSTGQFKEEMTMINVKGMAVSRRSLAPLMNFRATGRKYPFRMLRPLAAPCACLLSVLIGACSGAPFKPLSCVLPCTPSGHCSLIMPVPYGAEHAVLSATTSLELDTGSVVTAGNGAPGPVANLGWEITVERDHASVGAIVSRASVALGAGATVNGPLKTGGILLNPSGAMVSGAITTNALVAEDRHELTRVTFAGGPNVDVIASSHTLAPGSYGKVMIGAGGTLELAAGTYWLESLTVLPNASLALDESAGTITVFVKHTLEFAGTQMQQGGDGNVLIAAFGCDDVVFRAPFRGTVSAQNARLLLAGPPGSAFAGRYFANKIRLGADNKVVGLATAYPAGPPLSAGGVIPKLPPPLPAPPPPVPGCYAYTANGWNTVPCATDAYINSHFPLPDTQVTLSSSATPSLVFGQLAVTITQLTSEQNGFLASTASISPLCQTSGSPVANQWSVQNNTNAWVIASGSNAGDTAATQFTLMSNGANTSVCIWNVNVSSQGYAKQCYSPAPAQRAGGLQPFDMGNIAAYTNTNGTLSMVASFTWVPPGQPTAYSVVAADTYGLNGNWNEVSGGIIGQGNCSQAQFTNAEEVTQAMGSTCPADVAATSAVCAPPTLQPNAGAFQGGNGTAETNNLTAVDTPVVSYPNADLAVTNVTGTTTGSCLGPSHAYVKDNVNDFGATPSTIGGQVFWESPDIFLVPSGTPVDLNAVSTETTITPGGQFDIYVRVHNDLGCSDVTGAKAQVYLANPSALSVQWTPITGSQYVGNNGSSTGVTVPAGGQALIGPLTFTAPSSGLGNGHKCLLADIEATGEPPPANTYDAPDSNQVGQRNLQFVGPCEYPLTNATTVSGLAQITLSLTPATGTGPSLTTLPDVEVAFDDSDSSWYNVWNVQTGAGTTFAVTHDTGTGTTTVRLGAFSVALNAVPLANGESRNATGTINLPSGDTATLQIAAQLTETGAGGSVLVSNGGSCSVTAPVYRRPQ